MSIFKTILGKLGFGKTAMAAEPQASAQAALEIDPVAVPSAGSPELAVGPTPISKVDVVAHLEAKAAANKEKLNWKVSIVDLLKLLGLDSSLTARKELAAELHCPAEKMGDSSQMNMWLHKTVLQKLADNGGNIPPELLN